MQLTCSTLASPSNKLSCETRSFSHHSNPHCSPESALSLSFPFSQPPHTVLCLVMDSLHLPVLPVWLVWLTVSLIPWLLEFHAVWFFGTSGCSLISVWLLSFFWLCEEAKGFYLPLHLGLNSRGALTIVCGTMMDRHILHQKQFTVSFKSLWPTKSISRKWGKDLNTRLIRELFKESKNFNW